jgi:hypothetical protein
MRSNKEYELAKAVATYLRLQYPKVIFHFDLAGLNLSRAQAGMMKAIQGGRGWPDLFIAEPKGEYSGLFIELKPDKTKLHKTNGEFKTPHLFEQMECINRLWGRGYKSAFGIGFDNTKKIIDNYMNF